MAKQLLKERFQQLAGIKSLSEEGDKKIPKAGLGGFSAGPGPRTPLDPNLYKKSQGNNSFGSAGTDKRSGQVIGDIIQLIRSTGIDPSDVMEEVGQEFGINFEFGRG